MLQCKETRCHWNKGKEILGATTFDISCLQIENIVNEFGGERKGSKLDTLLDGIAKSGNKALAERLLGKHIILSRTPKHAYLTTLPVDVLKQVPLPPEIEALFTTAAPTSPAANSQGNTSLASVFQKSSAPAPNMMHINEERKLVYQSKEFFRQLAAHLKLLFVDQSGDKFIFEVVRDQCLQEGVANSILNAGEPISANAKERELIITFGIQKPVTV